MLCREYGLFKFPSPRDAFDEDSDDRVVQFVLNETDHERVLDVIEVSFHISGFLQQTYYEWERRVPKEKFDAVMQELNARFVNMGSATN